MKAPLFVIGQKVKIISTPSSFAGGKIGTLIGTKEGGYTVEIETEVPKPGVVPRMEKELVTVWADNIEPYDN